MECPLGQKRAQLLGGTPGSDEGERAAAHTASGEQQVSGLWEAAATSGKRFGAPKVACQVAGSWQGRASNGPGEKDLGREAELREKWEDLEVPHT